MDADHFRPVTNKGKSLFMKTYGKYSRKLTAWISPDNRKNAFESSGSDVAVSEPTTRTRVEKKSVDGEGSRPAKRKAMVCLKEESDQENSFVFSPPAPCPFQQSSKPSRKRNFALAQRRSLKHKDTQVLSSSENETDSMSAPKRRNVTTRRKKNYDCVTRHRGDNTASKPKLLKDSVDVLNSSDDFALRRSVPKRQRFPQPSRQKTPSAKNLGNNAISAGSYGNSFLQEVSLNKSAEGGLGPCPRKPLFCSTPAARHLDKTSYPKPFPILIQSSFSSSGSVTHPSLLSTSQEILDLPADPFFPPKSPPLRQMSALSQLHVDPNTQHHGAPKGSSVMKQGSVINNNSCSVAVKRLNEYTGRENGSDILSSTPHSAISSDSPNNYLTPSCAADGSQTTYTSCLDNLSYAQGPHTTNHEGPVKSCKTFDRLRLEEEGQSVDASESSVGVEITGDSWSMERFSVNHTADREEYTDRSSMYVVESANHQDDSLQCLTGTNSADNDQTPSRDPGREESIVALIPTLTQKCLTGECEVPLKRITSSQLTTDLLPSVATQPSESSLSRDYRSVQLATNNCESATRYKSQCHQNKRVKSTNERERASHVQPGAACCPVDQTPSSNRGSEGARDLAAILKEECLTKTWLVRVKKLTKVPPSNPSPQVFGWASTPADQTQPSDHGSEGARDLAVILKEECLTKTWLVPVKRLIIALPSNPSPEDSASKVQSVSGPCSGSDHRSKRDQTATSYNHGCNAPSGRVTRRESCSVKSESKPILDRAEALKTNPDDVPHKRRKRSPPARKDMSRRRMSKGESRTTRKAGVSGLSINRWKDKGNNSSLFLQSKPPTRGDCGNTQLLSSQQVTSKMFTESMLNGTSVIPSTPLRSNLLNLSSLLADRSSDTHTWSRLKAALSIHRKTKVFVTPRRPPLSRPCSPGKAGLADLSQDLFASPIRTPLPKRLLSQLSHRASLSTCEDNHLPDAEKVYMECGQPGPLSWEECILPQRIKKCVKIGEGTFGEVFSTSNAVGDTVALKVIPVEGGEKVNGEVQKTFGEILHEIIISKELSSLKDKENNQTHGFIGLNDLHCVQGCYPPALLKAWDTFDQQKGSENDRPDFFEKEQMFLILEFEFGGSDLENSNGTLSCLAVAKGVLHQVTAALAVAEQELNFEHRDLHWGNVLVKTTKMRKGNFLLNGTNHSLETKGVLVRIIDYSLSRLEIDGLTVSCDISEDEELFMGQGDYQFEIYRLMRQENGNSWSEYQPHSNILWLHYLCSKLLSMKYRITGWRGAKKTRMELDRFQNTVLQYGSATEVLQSCPLFQ